MDWNVTDGRTARAARLRCVRGMTGKSREFFQARYGVPRGTLQNWESARHGGLTERGAKIILKAFRAEQVSCSFSWLMYGVGEGPRLMNDRADTDILRDHPELEVMTKEMLYFRNKNDNAIDYVLKDDAMAPLFMPGDYICGCRYYQERIIEFVDQVVIAQSVEHGHLLRILKAGDSPDRYHLVSSNLHDTFHAQFLLNVELISVAPIKWHRRALLAFQTGLSNEVQRANQTAEI